MASKKGASRNLDSTKVATSATSKGPQTNKKIQAHRYSLTIPGTGRITIVINVPQPSKAATRKTGSKKSAKPDTSSGQGGSGIMDMVVVINVGDASGSHVADQGTGQGGSGIDD